MKEITELQGVDLRGKNIIVRADYNLAVQDGKILDDLRIKSSFKTIEFLRSLGATVILISHIENKEGTGLNPVASYMHDMHAKGLCGFDIIFHDDLNAALAKSKSEYSAAGEGAVHLLQNLRTNEGEEKNDPVFVQSIATLGDMYINEAFPVCHRKHASVIGVPALLPHYAGFQLIDEVAHMNEGLKATHPFIFVLGGAKFETKLPLIEKFIDRADQILIVGALLNDILKAKGFEVGKSLVSEKEVDLSAIIASPKLLLPEDVIVKDGATGASSSKKVHEVGAGDMIVDIGESLVQRLGEYIDTLSEPEKTFILWNGPLGLYEKGFETGTVALADLILKKKIKGLVGGGDTTAAIAKCALSTDKSTDDNTVQSSGIYISTGGGAMIEYLMKESLPGVDALK